MIRSPDVNRVSPNSNTDLSSSEVRARLTEFAYELQFYTARDVSYADCAI